MPTENLVKSGTPIILGKSSTHSPAAANNLGAITDEIDLTSLAAGNARQSAKFNFGDPRAAKYKMKVVIEFATAPIAGEILEFRMGFSNNATAANANDGGLSGVDAAYSGYSSNLEDSLEHLILIGTMYLTVQATGTVQKSWVGTFEAGLQYGQLVVVNRSATDNLHNDMVEMSILITPIVDESQ